MKNADLKIWSFLVKNRGLIRWKKVDFRTKYKYSFKIFQSNHCLQIRPLRHFLGSQGGFKKGRDPWGHKKVKKCPIENLVIFDLTPRKKVVFWTKYKYSFKSFQSNQCVRKRPLRHFSGSHARDQGQRNSPQRMISG